jgi:PhnB protein
MSVQPYLFFGGRCDEALEFYRTALGAEVEVLSRFKDAPDPGMAQPGMEEKVMHASFRIGETILMASDGRCEGETRFDGFSLSIIVPDEATADRTFNALARRWQSRDASDENLLGPKIRHAGRPVRGRLDDLSSAQAITIVAESIGIRHRPKLRRPAAFLRIAHESKNDGGFACWRE